MQLAHAPSAEWALVAAKVGEDLENELADPRTLANTSRRIAEVAHKFGCLTLVGASDVGDRLAAATVALAQDGLHLRRPGETDPALIVDGLLASGASLTVAAWHLKREGVGRAIGAVVIKSSDAEVGPEVDEVVVLDA